MGCGDSREKIEDEMIKLKFQRAQIQMERKKQIKILEGIEKKKIAEPIIPDYISVQADIVPKTKQPEKKKKSASEKKKSKDKNKKKSQEKNKNKSVKGKIKPKKTSSTKPESKKNGK